MAAARCPTKEESLQLLRETSSQCTIFFSYHPPKKTKGLNLRRTGTDRPSRKKNHHLWRAWAASRRQPGCTGGERSSRLNRPFSPVHPRTAGWLTGLQAPRAGPRNRVVSTDAATKRGVGERTPAAANWNPCRSLGGARQAAR